MRLAYFDCFSGISGDMALAALIHAGADIEAIRDTLRTFPIDDLDLEVEEVEVRGIAALRVHVRAGPQGVIRTYSSIRALLDQSELPEQARRIAQRAYQRLAEAAASAHGKEPELVTFHEFGEIDCLVDIVGCATALDMLHAERVFASPVPTGMGMVRTEHGIMPIPSPVVMELLQGVPTYSRGIPLELVTPTGAAILAAVSEGYGDMPMMRADQVGYGAGSLRLDFPNVVRVVIGEEQRAGGGGVPPGTTLQELITQGEVLVQAWMGSSDRSVCDRLLEELEVAGALDAWVSPGEGRGGDRSRTVLTVLATADLRETVLRILRAGHPDRILVSPVVSAPTAL
ncbi:MAG TPA: LarC family nickel insertion protein [Actinomycetota bacterium]